MPKTQTTAPASSSPTSAVAAGGSPSKGNKGREVQAQKQAQKQEAQDLYLELRYGGLHAAASPRSTHTHQPSTHNGQHNNDDGQRNLLTPKASPTKPAPSFHSVGAGVAGVRAADSVGYPPRPKRSVERTEEDAIVKQVVM